MVISIDVFLIVNERDIHNLMPKVVLTKNNLEYSYLLDWGTQGANNARDKWRGGVVGMYGVNASQPFSFSDMLHVNGMGFGT